MIDRSLSDDLADLMVLCPECARSSTIECLVEEALEYVTTGVGAQRASGSLVDELSVLPRVVLERVVIGLVDVRGETPVGVATLRKTINSLARKIGSKRTSIY
jgi:hypothetical protein